MEPSREQSEAVPKLQFLEQLLTPEKIAKAVTA
jgi:hypothetical protein